MYSGLNCNKKSQPSGKGYYLASDKLAFSFQFEGVALNKRLGRCWLRLANRWELQSRSPKQTWLVLVRDGRQGACPGTILLSSPGLDGQARFAGAELVCLSPCFSQKSDCIAAGGGGRQNEQRSSFWSSFSFPCALDTS